MEMLVLCVILFLISLALLLKRTKSFVNHSKLNLPPSPPGLPIIGNLHQLGTHPHRAFRALSDKYGPLMLLHLGRVRTLVVSSAEMVREMIKYHDVVVSNRPKITSAEVILYNRRDIGFAQYGEYWRQARKVCVLEVLSVKRVQEFQFIRDEEAAALVWKIGKARDSNEGGLVNLSQMLIAASNNILSRCVLGRNFVEVEGPSRFGELARRIMIEFVAFSVGDYFPCLRWVDRLTGRMGRLRRVFKELDSFYDEVLEEHKAVLEAGGEDGIGSGSGTKDFADILLGLQKRGMLDFELTSEDVKAILMDMFVGGSDTTSSTMEWAMAELLRSPRAMKKVQEEIRRVVGDKSKIEVDDINQMEYLKCVIRETLRLHPPAPLLVPRETTASIELGGFRIPEKTRVFINAWAVQRDPKVWDEAEEFVPERFEKSSINVKGQDFELIPFGSGRRGCPGVMFAVASTEYLIANVLYWFDWKLPNAMKPEELDMNEVYGQTVNRKVPLNLVPKPYYSS